MQRYATRGSPRPAARSAHNPHRRTLTIRFNHIAPHFYASDIARSREFYERVLGFSLHYVDGEPAHYIVMFRDEVYVHFSHAGPLGVPRHPGAAFVTVEGAESLWAQVKAEPDAQ